MVTSFKAYLIDKVQKGANPASGARFVTMRDTELDAGDVLIRVHYSSVNHKDAQAATGNGRVVRRFPCVGGIDLAGVVEKSAAPRFRPGDPVIATNYDLGVAFHGGYAEYALVPGGWVLPLPPGMSLRNAMAIGTAGLAAGMAISRMEDNGLKPETGSVVVTGASGGVGSLAVDMLSARGYVVTAMTGKPDRRESLIRLGARTVIARDELAGGDTVSLGKGLWAGAIDVLGGEVLAWLLATSKPTGVVASLGCVESAELRGSVMPFAQRGVSLLGIDTTYAGFAVRERAWGRLAADLRPQRLAEYSRVVEFEELPGVFDELMTGRHCGRTVVRIAKEGRSHD